RVLRKSIARIYTVINQARKLHQREIFSSRRWVPKDLRPKKTRAIRRRLSRKERRMKTPRAHRLASAFPRLPGCLFSPFCIYNRSRQTQLAPLSCKLSLSLGLCVHESPSDPEASIGNIGIARVSTLISRQRTPATTQFAPLSM
ncbi:unnamed protein product, partial [Protopolystoma xenopodis]